MGMEPPWRHDNPCDSVEEHNDDSKVPPQQQIPSLQGRFDDEIAARRRVERKLAAERLAHRMTLADMQTARCAEQAWKQKYEELLHDRAVGDRAPPVLRLRMSSPGTGYADFVDQGLI
jgi:hypothetical protein